MLISERSKAGPKRNRKLLEPFVSITLRCASPEATLRGATDDLTSPAARLVLGRVVEAGTGALGIMQQLPASDTV